MALSKAQRDRFKNGPTGPSSAQVTRNQLMEGDKKQQQELERGRTELVKSGKAGKRRVSTYRFEVYKMEPKLLKREQAYGATELKAKKKALTQGLKRGSYQVRVFNESTGKTVK